MQNTMKTLASGLVWAALVACYCARASDSHDAEHGGGGSVHIKPSQQQDDLAALQMDGGELTMVKRAWNSMPQNMGWGKRAWRSLQNSGWGKRYADSYPADKRAWQKFQTGWGKRYSPDDEWSLAESSDNELQQYDDYGAIPQPADFDDFAEEEKRTWRALNSPWGKRATHDWGSFRGSWGKRDPAWNNLKGLWGKRSIQDRISS